MTLKFIAATLLPLFRRETKFTAADEIFTVVLMVDDLFGSTRVVLHVVKVFYYCLCDNTGRQGCS